jgi:hypothetical protein
VSVGINGVVSETLTKDHSRIPARNRISQCGRDGGVLGRHLLALLARPSEWGRRAGGLDKPGPLLGESGEGLSSGRPARQWKC